MIRMVLVFSLAGALSLHAQSADTLKPNAAAAEKGKGLFTSRGCVGCHTIGKGKLVGPDLQGVTQRRSLAWVRRMILTPDVMLTDDSTAKALKKEHGDVAMPNLRLSEEEAEALIQYIASQNRK